MTESSWILAVGGTLADIARSRRRGRPATDVHPSEPKPPPEALVSGDPGPRDPAVPRTGVVWVHGIGTQKPGDSLFDWTRPILDVLAGWRRDHDENPDPEHPDAPPFGENPVRSASVSDPDNRWISVDIPKFQGRPKAEWLFTEAYWAGDVRPPSFSAAAAYLLSHLRMIIRGIAYGYGERRDSRKRRIALIPGQQPDAAQEQELAKSSRAMWKITNFLDWIWSTPPLRFVLMVVATGVALIALGVYAALHAIPFVSKRIEIAAADTFIVEWFADLAVILDDQAQAAAVRGRLLDRVWWLRRLGCEDVVLIAHSGGTIVSYATLLRFGHNELPVTKLMTLGEAIKLGWHLEQESGDWAEGNPVRGDLKARHRDLRWVDFWASYDPAPGGPMTPEEGCPLRTVDKLSDEPHCDEIEVESRPVINFMHLADDHGGYWSNDEGFLIPVIRHIDDPHGNGDASRFYRNAVDRVVRTERRRRRVSLLLGWRWASFAAVALSLLGLAFGQRTNAADTGGWVATTFGFLPGHEIVSGTIDGVGRVVATILQAIGGSGLVEAATSLGPTLLGAFVPLVAIFVIYSRGVGSWTAHDALERRAIRPEKPGPSGFASAHSEAILVLGGLLAVVLASTVGAAGFTVDLAGQRDVSWVVVCLIVTAVIAFVARFFLGNRPKHGAVAARIAGMIGPT